MNTEKKYELLQQEIWKKHIQSIVNDCYYIHNNTIILKNREYSEILGSDGPFNQLIDIFKKLDFSSPNLVVLVDRLKSYFTLFKGDGTRHLIDILKLYLVCWNCNNGLTICYNASTHFDNLKSSIKENEIEALVAMFWSSVCRRFNDLGLSSNLAKAANHHKLSIESVNRLLSFNHLLYCELSFINCLQKVASDSILISKRVEYISLSDAVEYFCNEFQTIVKILLYTDRVFEVDVLVFATQVIKTIETLNVHLPVYRHNPVVISEMDIPRVLYLSICELRNHVESFHINYSYMYVLPVTVEKTIHGFQTEMDDKFQFIFCQVWDIWIRQLMTSEPIWNSIQDENYMGYIGSWMIRDRTRRILKKFYVEFQRYNRNVDISLKLSTCRSLHDAFVHSDDKYFPNNLFKN